MAPTTDKPEAYECGYGAVLGTIDRVLAAPVVWAVCRLLLRRLHLLPRL